MQMPLRIELQEPQASRDARNSLVTKIGNDGLAAATALGFSLIRDVHEPFGKYLNELGSELNKLSLEGGWPAWGLKTGACLGALIYKETGVYTPIDESVMATAGLYAAIGGVPDSYIESLASDPVIADLSMDVIALEGLRDDGAGLQQVMDIGIGCARFHLQQALAA